jgi:hypothetical protein
MLSCLLAVLAACANATFSVLQHNANREVPRSENLSWRPVRSLLHEPVWFAGILAITVGFLLQAAALGNGQLATVEPVLARAIGPWPQVKDPSGRRPRSMSAGVAAML